MPNWCETRLTFSSNGTEEGNKALIDFYNNLISILSKNEYDGKDVWEETIENTLFSMHEELKDKTINRYYNKRGYIDFIDTINNECFHMVCYDAWCPNIEFWYILVTTLYQNLIDIQYIAHEPGNNLFETNDKGLLPRYNIWLYINGINDLMNFRNLIDKENSYGPFLCLDRQNPDLSLFNGSAYFVKEYDGEEDEILNTMHEDGFCTNSNSIDELHSDFIETDNTKMFVNNYSYSDFYLDPSEPDLLNKE